MVVPNIRINTSCLILERTKSDGLSVSQLFLSCCFFVLEYVLGLGMLEGNFHLMT